MNIHFGNIIKNRMFSLHLSAREVAKELGVSRNTVHNMLKRKYLHPLWVEKLSVLLQYNFFQHFYQPSEDVLKKLESEELQNLRKQLADLQKENTYLKEINQLLKKK